MQVKAYIGFGSNVGDLIQNFSTAEKKIEQAEGVQCLRGSRLYYSEPLTPDGKSQPWYLNAVFEVQTTLTLHQLFIQLKRIEMKMGRLKKKRWAPRVIDLDILFYDQIIFEDELLRVPHREILNRKFVLYPMNDLAPDFAHPEYKMTMQELLGLSEDPLRVRAYSPELNSQI